MLFIKITDEYGCDGLLGVASISEVLPRSNGGTLIIKINGEKLRLRTKFNLIKKAILQQTRNK